jgi:hypothetical protein
LIKAGSLGLDYNRALGNVTALYRSALGSNASEVQIPLPHNEKSRVRPEELTDVEIERAIVPLFDYFDANLHILNTYLSETAKDMVMMRVWKEILVIIEGLLIPPLSKLSSDMKPLSDKEVDIVFKWLKVRVIFLCAYIPDGFKLVPPRLFLCGRRRRFARKATKPEISGCCLHSLVL